VINAAEITDLLEEQHFQPTAQYDCSQRQHHRPVYDEHRQHSVSDSSRTNNMTDRSLDTDRQTHHSSTAQKA